MHAFTNLYGCSIGSRTKIGTFVEIQRGAAIGSDCKIQGHTFICDGVTIRDRVFVGHGVIFINDRQPSRDSGGRLPAGGGRLGDGEDDRRVGTPRSARGR